MRIFTRRRGVALLGLAGAALMAALAVAPAAQAAPETATHTFVPGLLLLPSVSTKADIVVSGSQCARLRA